MSFCRKYGSRGLHTVYSVPAHKYFMNHTLKLLGRQLAEICSSSTKLTFLRKLWRWKKVLCSSSERCVVTAHTANFRICVLFIKCLHVLSVPEITKGTWTRWHKVWQQCSGENIYICFGCFCYSEPNECAVQNKDKARYRVRLQSRGKVNQKQSHHSLQLIWTFLSLCCILDTESACRAEEGPVHMLVWFVICFRSITFITCILCIVLFYFM